MKRNYKKIVLSFVLLTFSFVSFAQLPNPDGTDGIDGGPGTTDPPAEINSKLILIAIIGLVFAYYQFKSKTRKV
jgi:mannose/fructose/N-acetylgalactosamine-specific phosphotransferase system component IIC